MTPKYSPRAADNPVRIAGNEPKFLERASNCAGKATVSIAERNKEYERSGLPSTTNTTSISLPISLPMRPKASIRRGMFFSFLYTGITTEYRIIILALPLVNGRDDTIHLVIIHFGIAGQREYFL